MRNDSYLVSICISFIFSLLLILPSSAVAESKTCDEILDELRKKHAGQFETVVSKFKKEAEEGTNPAKAYYILGIAHNIKGMTSKARNYYEQSIQIQPNNNPASKFLDNLNKENSQPQVRHRKRGGRGRNNNHSSYASNKQSRRHSSEDAGQAPKSTSMVDATAIQGVSPEKLAKDYSRYKGKTVILEGWILDAPSRKSRKTEIVCSTLSSQRGSSNMDGYFLIQTSEKLPDDDRISRGARISVRGIVADRDFIQNPTTKEMSKDRKIIINPAGLRINNKKVQSGPLTVKL